MKWHNDTETVHAPNRRIDLLDKAEGFRYISRLTRAALEGFVENNDPLHPVMRPALPWNVKMGEDNPDNYYQVYLQS